MEKCIDISKHQTSFDANKCKNSGVTTVICRLAYGTSQDSKVATYLPAAKNAGLTVGAYGFGTWHYKDVCNMNLDVARKIMKEQVGAWIEIANRYGPLTSWLGIDQELEKGHEMGLSIGDNTTLLIEAADMIKSAGLNPCLYTGAAWCMKNVNLDKFKHPLWIAYYKWYGTQKNFDNAAETFPANSGTYGTWMNSVRDRICAWQFSSEGYADKYGCVHGSNGLDKNWLYAQPNTISVLPGPTVGSGKYDEKAYFPMSYLRVTQGYGVAHDGVAKSTYSHNMRKALDLGGKNTNADVAYAPFSCKVERIYNGSSADSKCNFTWITNTKRVLGANGTVYDPGMIHMQMAHCNDANMVKYGVKEGAVFAQGQICYSEGTAGNVGNHLHIGMGEGKWSYPGWYKLSTGDYEVNNSIFANDVLFLRSDCNVLNDGGYKWKYDNSSDQPPVVKGPIVSQESSKVINQNVVYFSKYTGNSGSIVAGLKAVGEDSSYSYRCTIAAANGITGYTGTAAQNINMLYLLKQGMLIKPVTYFKKYTGTSGSIILGLMTIGEQYSFSYRAQIAEKNGISTVANYKGTASQNITMLNKLKAGALLKP